MNFFEALNKAYNDYVDLFDHEPEILYLGKQERLESKKIMELVYPSVETESYRGIPIEWTSEQFCLRFR